MNLWRKLSEEAKKGGSTQLIASYLLSYRQELQDVTCRQLAQMIGVSAASLVRFCQHLGYAHFTDLKVAYALALRDDPHALSLIKETTTTYAMMQKVAALSCDVIEKTRQALDYTKMDEALAYILQAECVDLYGRGMNRQLLEMEKYHFVRIGIQANQQEFRNARFAQALNANPRHVALIISHRGRTSEYLQIARLLKQKKVPLIVLCGLVDAPLAKLADVFIEIDSGAQFEEMGTIVFKVSAGYVLDTLFALALARKGNQIQTRLDEFEQLAHYLDS